MPLLRCKWVDPGQRIRGAPLKMLAAATLALTEFLAAARAMIWRKVFRLERARNIACGHFCTQPSSTGDLAIRPFTSKRCSRSAQFCLTWATSRICHRERSNASSMSLSRTRISILVYALLLGWLQHRRFEREAAARGTTLSDVPGMLNGALRLAVAAGVAIGIGLAVRAQLLELVPGVLLPAILIRATVLCAVGIGTYVTLARILGVRELTEIEGMLLRRLKLT